MSEIRIQKIDGVEFVTYKDYLRLKEEKQKLKEELNEWVNGAINSLRETPELLNRKE